MSDSVALATLGALEHDEVVSDRPMLDELASLYSKDMYLRPDDVFSSDVEVDHSRERVPDMDPMHGEPDQDPVVVGHGRMMFDPAIREACFKPTAYNIEDTDPHPADVVVELGRAEVLN